MSGSFTFLIIATAMLIVTVALLKIGKVRYVYIVPGGFVPLKNGKPGVKSEPDEPG